MSNDFLNQIAAAVAQAAENLDMNQTQAAKTGPSVEPGFVLMVLTGYTEFGKHEETYQGKKKLADKAMLSFEVIGPTNQPYEVDGKTVNRRFDLSVTLSQSEKASWPKLFRQLNYTGKYKHISEMLGHHWKATIRHENGKSEATKDKVYATVKDANSNWTFAKPCKIEGDELSGNVTEVPYPCPKITSPMSCFLWNNPSMFQWDSIFIDGQYEAEGDKPARSKNWKQEKIMKAKNFEGSPIYELIDGGAAVLGDALANIDTSVLGLDTALPSAAGIAPPASKPATPVATATATAPAEDDGDSEEDMAFEGM